jgi:alkanesulfonate monooxygenase SsuD/methylene tetrahydromethanopterin reductase-like flavin-dependent oxidoreductase (luciferase family)
MPYLDAVGEYFESFWFPDHVQYGAKNVAEGWSLLAFALARYPNKLQGHQVLCNSFRNPAHLAKATATCQILSGGRVVLGIGAGWNEEEYLAYGWPFPKTSVRAGELAEAIQICRLLWSQSPVTFEGKHYQLRDAYCHPHPDPLPPIMVGGKGEKYLLRVVAEHADWWNYIYQDRATYAHKQQVLKEHCLAVGRDYDEIVQVVASHILVGESEADIARMKAQPHVRPTTENGFAGTPAQITQLLTSALEQGAHRINVAFADTPRLESTQLFIEAVLPHFR